MIVLWALKIDWQFWINVCLVNPKKLQVDSRRIFYFEVLGKLNGGSFSYCIDIDAAIDMGKKFIY